MTSVTAIVPTHDRPGLLATTLRSIVAQRAVELEVVVVDDGSADPDAVAAVVTALDDPRARLVRADAPRGVSAARNRGIDQAAGDWVAFCDDDDLWAPGKLARQLASVGEAHWVYAGDVAVDSDLRVIDGQPPLPPDVVVEQLKRWNPVPAGSSNVMVRTASLRRAGAFDPALRSGGDWDLWLRLAHIGPPAWVRAPLVAYRVHGAAMTQNRRRMLADAKAIATRHELRVDWARHFRWAAWDALGARQRGEALGHYARAVLAGDVASLGRAGIALAPWPVVDGVRRRRRGQGDPAWVAEAQAWLDAVTVR